MRFLTSLVFIAAAGLMAAPASAQYGQQVERTQAEIALEKATENLDKDREGRAESLRACATKDYVACTKLGDYYRKGWGGLQDYEKAAEAYRKACNGKDAAGCASLAYLTNKGNGVEQDLAQSRLLYKKSCDLGEVSGALGQGWVLLGIHIAVKKR